LRNGDIVSAENDFIKVSSAIDGQMKYTLSDITNGTGILTSVVALYNGKIASFSYSNYFSSRNLNIWDLGNEILDKKISIDGGNDICCNTMTVLSNSHSWNNLVCGCYRTISIWNIETGQKVNEFFASEHGSIEYGNLLMTPFSNGDLAIVGTHYDKYVRIFNTTNGVMKMKINSTSHISSMIALWNGYLVNDDLVTGSKGYWDELNNEWNDHALITIWSVLDGKEKLVIRANTICTNLLVSLSANRLASTCRYGSYYEPSNIVEIWNNMNGLLIRTLSQEKITSLCAYYSSLFVGSNDGTVNVWNSETGKLEKTLRGHTGSIDHLTIISGSTLIGSSENKTIIVWNLNDGQIKTKFTESANDAPSVAASLSNGDLAIGTIGGRIKIWNTADQTLIRRINAHEENIDSLITLSNGQLVSRSINEIKIWGLIDGKMRLKIADEIVNKSDIIQIITLPNSDLITVRKDGQIRVWTSTTGSLKNAFKIQTLSCYSIYDQVNISTTLKSISVLPNSDLVTLNECYDGYGDKNIYVFDSNNGQLKRVIQNEFGSFYMFAILSNGYLATVQSTQNMNRQLKIMDFNNESLQRAMPLLELSPRNLVEYQNEFLAISGENKIQIWNIFETSIDQVFTINSSFITSYGHYLASISADKGSIDIISVLDGAISKTLVAHIDQINAIIFMPNGDLVSASSDRTIKVWDITQGLVKKTLYGHTKAVTGLLLVETGDLISGGLDGIKTWNTNDWKLKKVLADTEIDVKLFSNIGNGLIAGGYPGEIKVWNCTDGSIVKTLIILWQNHNLIGLSRSHKLVVTGPNYSCMTYIWDAKSDAIEYVPEIDYSYCISAFFYLKNGNLVVGFDNGLIEIWDFDENGTCKLKNRLAGHADSILSITELENGKLLSSSRDGNIFTWKI
jgi:WD40 repeat protein